MITRPEQSGEAGQDPTVEVEELSRLLDVLVAGRISDLDGFRDVSSLSEFFSMHDRKLAPGFDSVLSEDFVRLQQLSGSAANLFASRLKRAVAARPSRSATSEFFNSILGMTPSVPLAPQDPDGWGRLAEYGRARLGPSGTLIVEIANLPSQPATVAMVVNDHVVSQLRADVTGTIEDMSNTVTLVPGDVAEVRLTTPEGIVARGSLGTRS